jgi:hypothetical protein
LDYDSLLERVNAEVLSGEYFGGWRSVPKRFGCSLFSAHGNPDSLLYGRSFDNPECDVLMGFYYPQDGYASISFCRMSDLLLPLGIDPDTLSDELVRRVLAAPYFAADGMNECGLAAALAFIPGHNFTPHPSRPSVFVTRWLREILDHAATVRDAINISGDYNVFDMAPDFVCHHLLVTDSTGLSAVLEYRDGGLQVHLACQPWLVATNTAICGNSISFLRRVCNRYRCAHDTLAAHQGRVNHQESMAILRQVANSWTQWSAVFDLRRRLTYLVVDRDFDKVLVFPLEAD